MMLKKLFITILLLPILGCQFSQLISRESDPCSGSLETYLDPSNVKTITLTNQPIIESGQIRKDQAIGYEFNAEAGQKLNLLTEDNICIVIYAPNNQIINNKDLAQTGKYILQISVPQGMTTFEVKMSLDSPNLSVSTPTPTATPTPINTNLTRPPADVFVRNHYLNLNNRQYQETWNHLSPNFQKIAVNYSEYQKWWNSVKEIKIGQITIIDQSQDWAKVNAELWYVKHNNKVSKDTKSIIHLVWSDQANSWLFDYKTQP
jgi:hypothetical protein